MDSATEPAEQRHSRWFRQIPRDVVLIVAGALLAFAGEEVRDARHRRGQVESALAGIRDELATNERLVAAARSHHRFLADTLGSLAAHHMQPDVSIYSNGMFNPAYVTSTAWQAARETGALADMPLSIVLSIAPAYEAQERYRALSDAMNAAIMGDVRRDGMDTVLRDRFAQFVPLDLDFANREANLLEVYAKALRSLASAKDH